MLVSHEKKNWGRVIFISSESGQHIPAEMIPYGMTKTASMVRAAPTSAWRMARVASTSTITPWSVSIGISKEGMALVRPRPLGRRVGPRDELRRHRGCRAESGIV